MEVRAILDAFEQRKKWKPGYYPEPVGLVALREEGEKYLADRAEWLRHAAPPLANPYTRHDPDAEACKAYHEAKRQERLAAGNTPSQYPKTVTFRPELGIAAARRRSGRGGAWRVWILGRALDSSGLGMIRRDDLRGYVLALGVQRRTWERWINEARAHGFVSDVQKADGDMWLILAGEKHVAAALGVTVGRKVIMSAADLIGTGWKGRVYTTWENGKQISREKIQKTLNIPVRTQRYRAAQVEGYSRTRNYSKSNLRRDSLEGVKEYTRHAAPFVAGNGLIYWRLPDRRETAHATTGSKGRARKINRHVRSARPEGLLLMQQALAKDTQRPETVRLFNRTQAQLAASWRKIARLDRRIGELYGYSHETPRNAVIWEAQPVG